MAIQRSITQNGVICLQPLSCRYGDITTLLCLANLYSPPHSTPHQQESGVKHDSQEEGHCYANHCGTILCRTTSVAHKVMTIALVHTQNMGHFGASHMHCILLMDVESISENILFTIQITTCKDCVPLTP